MEAAPVKLSSEIVSQWQEWVGIVELFASRDPRRYAIDPQQYHDLHSTLLRFFQKLADSSNPGEHELLLQLKETLEPWVSLDALDQADREIVCKLADQCESISGLLGGRGRAGTILKKSWARRMLWGLVGVTAVGISLLWWRPITNSLLATPKQWFHSTLRLIGDDPTTQLVILSGILVTLVAIRLIWRPAN